MKTDALRVGGNVYFYRDKGFPGKRGPWPATVLEVQLPPHPGDGDNDPVLGSLVRLRVWGELGSVWTESDVPVVADPKLSEIRCCVFQKDAEPPVQPVP
jgi:hypothetical protein